MRAGPIITLAIGAIMLIGGVTGVALTPVPRAANRTWDSVGDRLRGDAAVPAATVDPAYAAHQRRFGWGACAALGVIAIALGISALRGKR